jgi:hypothetical protein
MTLDSTTLPTPNSFQNTFDRQGAYTKSLDGTTRRAINSDKNIWIIGYQSLTVAEFNAIKTLYDLKDTYNFVYSDFGINATVHLDIGSRTFIPGNPSYYSSVEIILREA